MDKAAPTTTSCMRCPVALVREVPDRGVFWSEGGGGELREVPPSAEGFIAAG